MLPDQGGKQAEKNNAHEKRRGRRPRQNKETPRRKVTQKNEEVTKTKRGVQHGPTRHTTQRNKQGEGKIHALGMPKKIKTKSGKWQENPRKKQKTKMLPTSRPRPANELVGPSARARGRARGRAGARARGRAGAFALALARTRGRAPACRRRLYIYIRAYL